MNAPPVTDHTPLSGASTTEPRTFLALDGLIVAPLEVAGGRAARRRGLLGRPGIDGAFLLRPAGSVHTVGMRFPIDVALCTTDLEVVAVRTVPPGRVTLPRRGVRAVIEAEAGSFASWGITAGRRMAIVSETIVDLDDDRPGDLPSAEPDSEIGSRNLRSRPSTNEG